MRDWLHGMMSVVGKAASRSLLLLTLALPASAAPRHYVLDPDASSVGFSTRFNQGPMKGTVKGTFPVTKAVLVLDFDNVAGSSISVTIDTADARTNLPFATQALRDDGVLATGRFPVATFQSTGVSRDGDGARVKGTLTLRGVTRPVTLAARIYRQNGEPEGTRDRLTVLLTGQIDRTDFGSDGWQGVVGDAVTLRILARVHATD